MHTTRISNFVNNWLSRGGALAKDLMIYLRTYDLEGRREFVGVHDLVTAPDGTLFSFMTKALEEMVTAREREQKARAARLHKLRHKMEVLQKKKQDDNLDIRRR